MRLRRNHAFMQHTCCHLLPIQKIYCKTAWNNSRTVALIFYDSLLFGGGRCQMLPWRPGVLAVQLRRTNRQERQGHQASEKTTNQSANPRTIPSIEATSYKKFSCLVGSWLKMAGFLRHQQGVEFSTIASRRPCRKAVPCGSAAPEGERRLAEETHGDLLAGHHPRLAGAASELAPD